MHGFYRLKQRKDVSVCWRQITNRYIKYDACCTIIHVVTKIRRPICTKLTVTIVFDKPSRAAFAKHTSYNWKNVEVSYLVLLVRYYSLDIQRKAPAKALQNTLCLVRNNCLSCISRNIYYGWLKLNLRFVVWIYLVPNVIQKCKIGLKWMSPCA